MYSHVEEADKASVNQIFVMLLASEHLLCRAFGVTVCEASQDFVSTLNFSP